METRDADVIENTVEGVDVRSCILSCVLNPPTHRHERFVEALSFLEKSEGYIVEVAEEFCNFMTRYGDRIRDPNKRAVLNGLRDILINIRSLYYQRRELSASFEVAWYEIDFLGHGLLGVVTPNVIDEIRRGSPEGPYALKDTQVVTKLITLEIERYIREHRRVLYLCTLIPAIDAAMGNGINIYQREELERIRVKATTEFERCRSAHRIPPVSLAAVIRDISEEYFRLVRFTQLNIELGKDGVIPRRRDYKYYVASLPQAAQGRFLEVMSSIREYQEGITRAIDRPYRTLYLFNSEVTKLSTFVHSLKLKDHQVLVAENLQNILVKGFVTEGGEFILVRSMDSKYIVLLEGFSVCFDKTSGRLLLDRDGMPILYPRCELYRIGDTLVRCKISNIEVIEGGPRRPKIG